MFQIQLFEAAVAVNIILFLQLHPTCGAACFRLSKTMDACTQAVRSEGLGQSLHEDLTLATLAMALDPRTPRVVRSSLKK